MTTEDDDAILALLIAIRDELVLANRKPRTAEAPPPIATRRDAPPSIMSPTLAQACDMLASARAELEVLVAEIRAEAPDR